VNAAAFVAGGGSEDAAVREELGLGDKYLQHSLDVHACTAGQQFAMRVLLATLLQVVAARVQQHVQTWARVTNAAAIFLAYMRMLLVIIHLSCVLCCCRW
jgi:hypothetical protein